jgi:hypothetical protein
VAGGQTVAVHRVKRHHGDTGPNGHEIYAVLNSTTIVGLTRYDQPEPIPTSTRLPCQGTGTVEFTVCPLPQPCPVGSKPDVVPVTYENLGA